MPPFKWVPIPNTELYIQYDNDMELYAIKDDTTLREPLLVDPQELPGLIAYLQTLPLSSIPATEG